MSRALRFFVFRMRFGYLIIAAGFVWYLVTHYPYWQHRPNLEKWNIHLEACHRWVVRWEICLIVCIIPAMFAAVFGTYHYMSTTEEQGITETEKSPEGMPITNGDCTDVRKVSDQYKSGGIHYEYRSEDTVTIPHPSYSGLMKIGESNNCHVYLKNGDIDLCEDTVNSGYYVRLDSIICKIASYTMMKGGIEESQVKTLEDVMIDNPVVGKNDVRTYNNFFYQPGITSMKSQYHVLQPYIMMQGVIEEFPEAEIQGQYSTVLPGESPPPSTDPFPEPSPITQRPEQDSPEYPRSH